MVEDIILKINHMLKSSPMQIKIIFLFILYLGSLYFLGFDLLNIEFALISSLFIICILALLKNNLSQSKIVGLKFDELYFSLFNKKKSHSNLSEILNSIEMINKDIVEKNINIVDLEKSRSKFLGNVSHEIKTPLFVLQGYIDTLLDGAINDKNVNIDFLQKIKKQSDRLQNLMEDLIKISMIESDELKLNIEKVNFKDIIESIKSNFEDVLIKRKDELILPDDINELYVDVDKKNIQIVFNNLVNNAISYSDKGNVIMSAKLEKNMLNIKIVDHGIGIDENNISRIFERFYRVDNDRSRSKGGTGLGLAIVKHILLAHNITISIESKQNFGSTFSFSLPISKT